MGSLFHAVAAAALVVAVVAVAYGTAAPSLGVAEFSPAARQEIEAPPTTGAASSAPVARARRASTTTMDAPTEAAAPTATDASGPVTTRAGRGRPCFGAPPRQLPDPRSPACVPVVFDSDNGGATSPGVSATEVRVAVMTQDEKHEAGVAALFEYMNRHFEFYGRRLVPVFARLGSTHSCDVPCQRAVADELASQGVFAAITKTVNSRWTPTIFQTLALAGVVSVVDGNVTPASDRELLDPWHPFVWSVYPSVEQQLQNQADFICSSLVGRPPRHAPALDQTAPRVFGVISVGNYVAPRARPLVDGLDACGATPATADVVLTQDPTGIRNALERLRSDGVTTVACMCGDALRGNVTGQLAGMDWAPEILMPLGNFVSLDEQYMQTDGQRSRVFGMQLFPKVLPRSAQWWYLAVGEVNPAIDYSLAAYLMPDYEQLLVLAAGIQGAGPALTPQTFGQGLLSATFPNSEAGQAPFFLPSVGFGPGDHSFYNDYALVWWSDTAEAFAPNIKPAGSWCYVGGGRRFSVGGFPADADARFFNESEPCR